ncbi:FtsL-like putative cell division protein [Seonamhaeicola sp.]|uniref:FtsL-like putative cell division protein n=1 Tax=Seonamhaeicola sp. TaxID=1912245 RepID=UPI0026294480|nr:FtsL-like putative cell division protein [Seonamhaeicola sp.]
MSLNLSYFLLTSEYTILTVLIVVVIFFALLLILGIRKSYKLKKENERLNKISEEMAKKKEEYKDFTEGHMYQ